MTTQLIATRTGSLGPFLSLILLASPRANGAVARLISIMQQEQNCGRTVPILHEVRMKRYSRGLGPFASLILASALERVRQAEDDFLPRCGPFRFSSR
jgi:hypothetical protein